MQQETSRCYVPHITRTFPPCKIWYMMWDFSYPLKESMVLHSLSKHLDMLCKYKSIIEWKGHKPLICNCCKALYTTSNPPPCWHRSMVYCLFQNYAYFFDGSIFNWKTDLILLATKCHPDFCTVAKYCLGFLQNIRSIFVVAKYWVNFVCRCKISLQFFAKYRLDFCSCKISHRF